MVVLSTRRILLGIYLAVLLAVLLVPVPAVPIATAGQLDKVAHVGLFLTLGFLATWSAPGGRMRRIRTALLVVVAWGVLTELIQGLLPYRSGDPLDLAADLTGGLIGALAGSLTRAVE